MYFTGFKSALNSYLFCCICTMKCPKTENYNVPQIDPMQLQLKLNNPYCVYNFRNEELLNISKCSYVLLLQLRDIQMHSIYQTVTNISLFFPCLKLVHFLTTEYIQIW